MAEYIDRTQIKWYVCDFEGGEACCKNQGDCSKCILGNCDHDEVMNIPPANVVEREKILDFIEDNRPTDVQTDWEIGCAYICDEIERLLNEGER